MCNNMNVLLALQITRNRPQRRLPLILSQSVFALLLSLTNTPHHMDSRTFAVHSGVGSTIAYTSERKRVEFQQRQQRYSDIYIHRYSDIRIHRYSGNMLHAANNQRTVCV